MKKYLSLNNLVTAVILGLVVAMNFTTWKNNFTHEGKVVSPRAVKLLPSQKETLFPPKEKNALLIFWASWCGPCKVEMNRLERSIKDGKIAPDSVFAINAFESDIDVERFLKENNYSFQFIGESSLGKDLGIDRTPTTIFLEKTKIVSMNSGMSLIGIWRAEWFLH